MNPARSFYLPSDTLMEINTFVTEELPLDICKRSGRIYIHVYSFYTINMKYDKRTLDRIMMTYFPLEKLLTLPYLEKSAQRRVLYLLKLFIVSPLSLSFIFFSLI